MKLIGNKLLAGYGLTRPAASASYLLDTYSAFAAYSVRQLSSTATNCMRVRRSSDDAEADIGFADGWLDETTLLAHVGAGDGFVTTMYDQAGSSIDATQTTAGSQPQIVASGVVNKLNGKPALFPQAGSKLITSTFTEQSQPNTWFVCGQAASGSANGAFCGGGSNNKWQAFYYSAIGGFYRHGLYAGSGLAGTIKASAQIVGAGLFNTTSSIIRTNGAEEVTGNAGANPIDKITIANANIVNYPCYRWQESIFYNSDQTANFEAIETDINTAFSVY
jgi:hypothetical protein